MTTYDRYILRRFSHVFAVFFVAAVGLYAVVDGFSNIDRFQQGAKDQGWGMVVLMGEHYLYQSAEIFDLIGSTLVVLSVMCTLALLLKKGEVHPLLAAGVPTYRLSLPFVLGVLVVNGAMAANQELIIPRIAEHLQGSRGETSDEGRPVEPMYDPHGIFIAGKELFLSDRTIRQAEFRLPAPTLAPDFILLRAEKAEFIEGRDGVPTGWRLKNVHPPFDELLLTEAGRNLVRELRTPGEVYVVSDVTFDQLINRTTSFRYLATQDLVQRIQRPTAGLFTTHAQQVHFHARLTRPLLTLIGLFLVIPLIVRREQMNLVTNIAVCLGCLGAVFGMALGIQFAGQSGLIAADLAVWAPLMIGGSLCAWLAPAVRT